MKIESTQWVSYSNHSSEQVSPSNNFHQLLFSVNIQYLPLPTHCQYLLFTKPYFKSILQNKCHWWNIFNLKFKFTHFEGKYTYLSWLPSKLLNSCLLCCGVDLHLWTIWLWNLWSMLRIFTLCFMFCLIVFSQKVWLLESTHCCESCDSSVDQVDTMSEI